MKVFFDCDVLLDVGLQREPHFDASARLLDWAERHPGRAALAWHSVGNRARRTAGIASFAGLGFPVPYQSPCNTCRFAMEMPLSIAPTMPRKP